MAKKFTNDKDFLIIEMTKEDCQKVGFGNVCDGLCGDIEHFAPRTFDDNENRYYIACLNHLMCKSCLDTFLATQTHYDDDESLDFEERHYMPIARKLGLLQED